MSTSNLNKAFTAIENGTDRGAVQDELLCYLEQVSEYIAERYAGMTTATIERRALRTSLNAAFLEFAKSVNSGPKPMSFVMPSTTMSLIKSQSPALQQAEMDKIGQAFAETSEQRQQAVE
jgi:hypothetical protein